MTERPRELGYFKRVVHSEAKFKVEGLRFAPMTIGSTYTVFQKTFFRCGG